MEEQQQERLIMNVRDLPLSIRTVNVLRNNGEIFLFQGLAITDEEFLRTPNAGRKSLNEFKEMLKDLGFEFGSLVPFESDVRKLAQVFAQRSFSDLDPAAFTAATLPVLKKALSDWGVIAPSNEVSISEKIGVIPGTLEHWLLERVPEELRVGLSGPWLKAVLADVSIQGRVADILQEAVLERLRLDKGPA